MGAAVAGNGTVSDASFPDKWADVAASVLRPNNSAGERTAIMGEQDWKAPNAVRPDYRQASAAVTLAVLDTNVWLDWLLFDDPGAAPLRAAQAAGALALVASPDTRAELGAVLARTAFGLDPAGVACRLAEHDRVTIVHERPAPRACSWRCTDPDDQKFLDLAVACNAELLLTKDRALLRLAGRMQRGYRVRIARPRDL